MNLNDYQDQAIKTDLMPTVKPVPVTNPAYMAKVLGLVGEAGEIAEKYKKLLRDKGGVISEADKIELAKELGDVLWYVAVLGVYLEVPLEDIANANLEKLASRQARDTLHGSGDNR